MAIFLYLRFKLYLGLVLVFAPHFFPSNHPKGLNILKFHKIQSMSRYLLIVRFSSHQGQSASLQYILESQLITAIFALFGLETRFSFAQGSPEALRIKTYAQSLY